MYRDVCASLGRVPARGIHVRESQAAGEIYHCKSCHAHCEGLQVRKEMLVGVNAQVHDTCMIIEVAEQHKHFLGRRSVRA